MSYETRSVTDFAAVHIRSSFCYGSQHDTLADYHNYCFDLFNYLSTFHTCLIGVKTP